MLHDAYHWLVSNGLYASIIAAAVAIPVAWMAAKLIGLARWGRAHFAVLLRIATLLDTSKPGGLTDVLEALKENKH